MMAGRWGGGWVDVEEEEGEEVTEEWRALGRAWRAWEAAEERRVRAGLEEWREGQRRRRALMLAKAWWMKEERRRAVELAGLVGRWGGPAGELTWGGGCRKCWAAAEAEKRREWQRRRGRRLWRAVEVVRRWHRGVKRRQAAVFLQEAIVRRRMEVEEVRGLGIVEQTRVGTGGRWRAARRRLRRFFFWQLVAGGLDGGRRFIWRVWRDVWVAGAVAGLVWRWWWWTWARWWWSVVVAKGSGWW